MTITIPANYQGWKRYRITLTLKTAHNDVDLINLNFNGDSGVASYAWTELSATGAVAQSTIDLSDSRIRLAYVGHDQFDTATLTISQPTTTQYKSVMFFGGPCENTTATNGYIAMVSGKWLNNANAISSIALTAVNAAGNKLAEFSNYMVEGNND